MSENPAENDADGKLKAIRTTSGPSLPNQPEQRQAFDTATQAPSDVFLSGIPANEKRYATLPPTDPNYQRPSPNEHPGENIDVSEHTVGGQSERWWKEERQKTNPKRHGEEQH